MRREKMPVTFSRTGFERPALNPALDFMLGDTPSPDAATPPPPSPAQAAAEATAASAAQRSQPTEGPSASTGASAQPQLAPPGPAHDDVAALATDDATVRTESKAASHPKARANLDLDAEVWDRFKDAVVYLRLTLTDAVTEAIAEKLDDLERDHGGPFPRRAGVRLRPGRRVQ